MHVSRPHAFLQIALCQDDSVHADISSATAPSSTASGDRTTDHIIRYDTWVGYNSTWKHFKVMLARVHSHTLVYSYTRARVSLQMWADETGASFATEEAKIEGRKVSYPYLLDAKGEPLLESTNDFLVWFCERCDIVTKKSVVEKAESWLKACGDLARAKFNPDGPGLRKGIFTEAMRVRVAIKGHAEAYGASSIASGKEVAARADNLLTHDQMTAAMHRSYAADQAIHSDPLRCLQTGTEVRITHQAGCRGQIVRSANWEHVWLHDYDVLADGDGINAVTLYNNRGDKTHLIGEGSHFGWMPNNNVLLCPSVALGTCMLYRFTARREAFPEVCADNSGGNPGYQYKWLPLLITTADTYEVDALKAHLPIHGVGKKSQSTCFKQLYAVSGVPCVTGDAIEHVGRAQAQQEAQNAGINARDVEEALGYEHSAKKDHYTPQIPLSFQLQRTSATSPMLIGAGKDLRIAPTATSMAASAYFIARSHGSTSLTVTTSRRR